MLSEIGLGLVCLGWLVQFFHSRKDNYSLSPAFMVAYSFGVGFLVIDAYSSGLASLASLNTLAMLLSVSILIKMKGRAGKPAQKKK